MTLDTLGEKALSLWDVRGWTSSRPRRSPSASRTLGVHADPCCGPYGLFGPALAPGPSSPASLPSAACVPYPSPARHLSAAGWRGPARALGAVCHSVTISSCFLLPAQSLCWEMGISPHPQGSPGYGGVPTTRLPALAGGLLGKVRETVGPARRF